MKTNIWSVDPLLSCFDPTVILEAAVDVSSDVIVEKPTALLYELSSRLYAVWFYTEWWFLTVFSELRGLHAHVCAPRPNVQLCGRMWGAQKWEQGHKSEIFAQNYQFGLWGPTFLLPLFVLLFGLETWNVSRVTPYTRDERPEGGNLREGRCDLITASAKQCVIHRCLRDLIAADHPKTKDISQQLI